MIKSSTPSSITYQDSDKKEIIFYGEWTLEPKFYLHPLGEALQILPNGEKIELDFPEKRKYLKGFLADARSKGWEIVLENDQ